MKFTTKVQTACKESWHVGVNFFSYLPYMACEYSNSLQHVCYLFDIWLRFVIGAYSSLILTCMCVHQSQTLHVLLEMARTIRQDKTCSHSFKSYIYIHIIHTYVCKLTKIMAGKVIVHDFKTEFFLILYFLYKN